MWSSAADLRPVGGREGRVTACRHEPHQRHPLCDLAGHLRGGSGSRVVRISITHHVSDLAGRTDPAVIWDDPTVLFTDPGLLGTAVEMRVTESVRACMEARGQTFRGPAVVESISSLLDPPRDGYGIAAGSDTPGRPSAAVALRRGIGSPMRPPCTGRHSIPLPRASGAVLPWALTPWRRP